MEHMCMEKIDGSFTNKCPIKSLITCNCLINNFKQVWMDCKIFYVILYKLNYQKIQQALHAMFGTTGQLFQPY